MTLPPDMRALQMQRMGELTEVRLPVPVPKPDEILIRTAAATICTSDLNDLHHNPFGIRLPRVLGHEGAGVVSVVGGQVEGFHPGDRVAGHPVIPCGACPNCGRGLGHLCDQMGHLGLDRDGTFAEYYCLRADRARRVAPGLDLAVAALLEPVAVCIEALERPALGSNDVLLVVGDGPFGVIITRLALGYRPKKIIFVGRHPFRLGQVSGVTAINQSQTPNIAEAVHAASNGAGADVAVLAVGNQAALDLCLASVRARGRVVVFSGMPGQASVDMFRVHVKELSILGACNDEDYIDAALERLTDPALRLETLVTHRVPLDQWPRAFELAEKGKDSALKVALMFGGNQ